MSSRPVIGITTNVDERSHTVRYQYAKTIQECDGLPLILPPCTSDLFPELLRPLSGILFSGGGDPDTTPYGQPLHKEAKLTHPDRQRFESALLSHLEERIPDLPIFGVCLGMQMMGLHAGGRLEQHLPDVLDDATVHADDHVHEVTGQLGSGRVTSAHHQAISDPGNLHVVARAPDDVIEAVFAPDRRFYLGVQWHPERTSEPELGQDLIARFVAACRGDDVDPV